MRISYDTDSGGQRTVVQRTYKDANDIQLTPVTPLLTARTVTGVPIDRSRLQPRYTLCCVPNDDNPLGKSDLKVICPYRPATANLQGHIIELLAYDNGTYQVEAITYFSEGLS